MCNEFQLRLNFGTDWWNEHGRSRASIRFSDAPSNRRLDQPFKPTDRAAMLRPIYVSDPAAGLESVDRRWWLVPFFHKGKVTDWKAMCTNARLETVETTAAFREAYKHRRSLIPITSFVEYDKPPGWAKGQPMRRWEVSWDPKDDFDNVRYLAGVWERSNPTDLTEPLESFAFVTGPPGADVGAVHDRQPAVMTFDQGMEWLRLDGPGKASLITETPPGTYRVTERPRELDFAAT